MQVEFLEKFGKDLDKVNQGFVKTAVQKTIIRVEQATNLNEIPQLKKLAGHKSAYRIRVGDYRIGIFVDGNRVQFARVANRKDIYKVFP
jgi:mRNA interferase RelE/StbE